MPRTRHQPNTTTHPARLPSPISNTWTSRPTEHTSTQPSHTTPAESHGRPSPRSPNPTTTTATEPMPLWATPMQLAVTPSRPGLRRRAPESFTATSTGRRLVASISLILLLRLLFADSTGRLRGACLPRLVLLSEGRFFAGCLIERGFLLWFLIF